MLILLTVFFIAGGIFFMIKADFKSLNASTTTTTTTNAKVNGGVEVESYDISNLKPGIPVIVGMVLLSIVLAIVFLLLLVKFPKCVFYTMLILGALLILALAVGMFLAQNPIGGGVVLALLVVYAAAIYCSREKIQAGVVLLETAANFIAERPSVFIAPIALLMIIVAFEIFWLVSLVAISLYHGNATNQQDASK